MIVPAAQWSSTSCNYAMAQSMLTRSAYGLVGPQVQTANRIRRDVVVLELACDSNVFDKAGGRVRELVWTLGEKAMVRTKTMHAFSGLAERVSVFGVRRVRR